MLEHSIWCASIAQHQWHSHGGQSATHDSKKFAKNQEKSEKKRKKSGRKGKNWEGSFTLPLLTDRAGYATAQNSHSSEWDQNYTFDDEHRATD